MEKKICSKEGFGQKTVLERNCPDSSFEAVTLIRSSGLPVQHKEAKSISSYCPGSGDPNIKNFSDLAEKSKPMPTAMT